MLNKSMTTWVGVAFVFFSMTGCGSKVGGLATDSGTMTIEEYQKREAEKEAALNGSMDAKSLGDPKPEEKKK